MILIIEKSKHISARLTEILSEAERNKKIYQAGNLEKAREILQEIEPGIVLLDCSMEHESFELLKIIKEKNTTTRVITICHRTDEMIVNKYESLGSDYFVDKYHDYEKIPEIIRKIDTEKEEPFYEMTS